MGEKIELEENEVRALPSRKHKAGVPLVTKIGDNLVVIEQGKEGLTAYPYDEVEFNGYDPETDLAVFTKIEDTKEETA